jgi:type VI secretion system secreted protein Hcp
MAGQVFLTVYDQGSAFQHSVVFDKGDPASWVHEFDHQVLYLGDKLFFDKSPIRVHKPVRLLIPIDKITPSLIQLVVQGQTVEKTMLRWFRYQEKTKSDTEYFRHIFETVAFEQFRLVLPDVKNPQFDKYEFALEVSFRYKKVTWTYMQGNLIVSDEWQTSEYEDGEDVQEEDENDEETNDVTEEQVIEPVVEDTTKKVKLSNAKFLPEEGKTNFKEKCNVTVNVEYLKETNKKKVLFKLFSIYKNNTQDMQHELEGFESGGKADAAVTLHYNDEYYSDSEKAADASVEYFLKVSHPEGDEIESERLKLPFVKQQTVQYNEIPDVLFNHNSAVPMIDTDEKLINAIVATLTFAGKNPEKEAIIYGHTDSSGETDYNIKLSELRCKSVKAFIDKKPQDFVNICKEKSKVEDYQTFLSVLTKKYSWECDPGSIDDQDGPKTKEALKQFQIDYNLFYSKSITEDGKIGPETWEAFFNVIMEQILGNANTESGDSAPKLKYGKNNGIYPCGEKYAQDAYAKKGRKSQNDRRVEIVFSDPSQPIEDTPYVDTIVMEPIEIVADRPPVEKKPKKVALKDFEMVCSHIADDGKKRIAKKGQALSIVPGAKVAPLSQGDKVTCTAIPADNSISVNWICDGYLTSKKSGKTAEFTITAFLDDARDAFTHLLQGTIYQLFPPRTVKVQATDGFNNTIENTILVYSNRTSIFEVDFQKIFEWLTTFQENLKKALTFLPAKIEPKLLVGKVGFEGTFAEAEGSPLVFYKWSVKGGFDPLIGFEGRWEVSLLPVANAIPSAIRKYLADICAVTVLKGGLATMISYNRDKIDAKSGKIEPKGSIAISFSLNAIVGKGKLLEASAGLSSAVEASGSIKITKEDNAEKWKFDYDSFKIEWAGLKGVISWAILDGLFSKGDEFVLVEPVKLYP